MLSFKEFFTGNIRIWLDDLRPIQKDYNYHAKTAKEAITKLKTGNVTHISFDHDLGPEDSGVGTGYEVATWIEEAAFKKRIPKLDWQIHSANPVGAKNISRAMQSAARFWSR